MSSVSASSLTRHYFTGEIRRTSTQSDWFSHYLFIFYHAGSQIIFTSLSTLPTWDHCEWKQGSCEAAMYFCAQAHKHCSNCCYSHRTGGFPSDKFMQSGRPEPRFIFQSLSVASGDWCWMHFGPQRAAGALPPFNNDLFNNRILPPLLQLTQQWPTSIPLQSPIIWWDHIQMSLW